MAGAGRRGSARLLVPAAGLACGMLGFSLEALVDRAGQLLSGGRPRDALVAPGVTVRRFPRAVGAVRVIEIDRSAPVRIEVAAEEIGVRQGRISGRSRTLPEWLQTTGAVAGVNGGYFGATVDERHKEIVGLLKRAGRVRAAAPNYRSRPEGRAYARSALGFTRGGHPAMAWITSRPGDPQALRAHAGAQYTDEGVRWRVDQALACGPRLIHEGKAAVSDRAERLVSRGLLPRTFVGFGGPDDRFVVLCAAEAMEFTDCADFLSDYFRKQHGAPCREAMCLDGGASTQAAWREGGRVVTEPESGTTVPTALLVFKR